MGAGESCDCLSVVSVQAQVELDSLRVETATWFRFKSIVGKRVGTRGAELVGTVSTRAWLSKTRY